MTELRLLSLELRGALEYEGGSWTGVDLGEDLAEDEDEIYLFDEASLIRFDDEEGPILRRPPPRPAFYGRRVGAPKDAVTPSEARRAVSLGPGRYLFVQWRPKDEEELLAGLEWFAREAWWEGAALSGPYWLRRVKEDRSVATQALRLIAPAG